MKVPDVLDFCSQKHPNSKINHLPHCTKAATFSTSLGFVQRASDWMNSRVFNWSKDALKVLEDQHTVKIRDDSMIVCKLKITSIYHPTFSGSSRAVAQSLCAIFNQRVSVCSFLGRRELHRSSVQLNSVTAGDHRSTLV